MRSKPLLLVSTLLAAALLGPLAEASAQRAKKTIEPTAHPLLWRIEGPGTGYCYGTIHLPDPRVTALPKPVTDALDAADAVYTEIELGGATVANMMKRLILPQKQTLADVLPEELYERLEAHLDKRGVPIRMFSRYRIWAVVMNIVMLEFQKSTGGSAGKALDMRIVEEAKDRDCETGALETLDEQLGVFEALTVAEQVTTLKGTLDLIQKMEARGENMAEKMIEMYLAGDADALVKAMDEFSGIEDDPELEAKFEKAMLDDRNARMAERIDELFKKDPKKVRFFAVGAAHWPGDKGMLKMLRDRGYQVTRIGAPARKAATPVRKTPAPVGRDGDGDGAAIERQLDRILERLEALDKRIEALEQRRERQAA